MVEGGKRAIIGFTSTPSYLRGFLGLLVYCFGRFPTCTYASWPRAYPFFLDCMNVYLTALSGHIS